MLRLPCSLGFAVALLVLAACPVNVHAQATKKVAETGLSKTALTVAKKVVAAVEVAQMIDDLTRSTSAPKAKAPYKATLQAIELRARFLLPAVEAERYVSNEVLGLELPHRRVTVRARVDCEVHAAVDLAKVRVEKDKIDYSLDDGMGGTKQEVLTIQKLTDDELVTVDPDGVKEEFKRVKEEKKGEAKPAGAHADHQGHAAH